MKKVYDSDSIEGSDSMKEAPFAKKRANPRFDFFADAEITLSNGTFVPGQLSELSAGGCCLTTLRSIPIGTKLSLRLSDGMSSCEVSGKVIYVNAGGGLGIFGIGVVFGEMSVDQRCTIDRWLRELAGRRIQRRPLPDSDWQWEQVRYEINRLKGVLLDPSSTVEERLIAQSQLDNYNQESEQTLQRFQKSHEG